MSQQTKINNPAVASCSLSVMECVLVWEFILLSRRQAAEVAALLASVRENETKELLCQRENILQAQCILAETLMRSVQMPIPSGKQTVSGEGLVCRREFAFVAVIRLTDKRIQALSYIMRSKITNTPLRMIAKEWLTQEAVCLEQLVLYAAGNATELLKQV